MTAAELLDQAAAAGVTFTLSDTGAIKATGDQKAVNALLPIIREHKPALVLALRILRMAAKWNYSPEELAWALSESHRDPAAWLQSVEADELAGYPPPHISEVTEHGTLNTWPAQDDFCA